MPEDLFLGWTRRQYEIAMYSLRREEAERYISSSQIFNECLAAKILLNVQREWEEKNLWAPLEGPMQLYDPVVSENVVRYVMTVWRIARAQEVNYPSPQQTGHTHA